MATGGREADQPTAASDATLAMVAIAARIARRRVIATAIRCNRRIHSNKCKAQRKRIVHDAASMG